MNTPTTWTLPEINYRRCNGCGICVTHCPTGAVTLVAGRAVITDPANCCFCEVCEATCPVGAINRPFTITFAEQPINQKGLRS